MFFTKKTFARYSHLLVAGYILASFLFASQSFAADLAAVYQMAEQSDPTYQQAVYNYRALLETKPQARAGLLPNISLNANTFRNQTDTISSGFGAGGVSVFNSHRYNLSLSQPLFRWDRYIAYRQSDSIISQANADLLAAKQDLIIRSSTVYFSVLGAYDNMEFARAERRSLSRQLDQAKQRFEVGLTAITDVQEAQAGYDRAVASEIEAQNIIDNALEELREIIGTYLEDYTKLSEDMPLLSPEPESIDEWTSTSLDQSLAVISSQYAVETARRDVELARAGHYPTLDLSASAGFSTSGGRFGSSSTHSDAIGLELNVPLFSGGAVNSRVKQSIQQLDRQLQALELARRTAQSDTRQAYYGVISGISGVKAFKQALVSSETALQATEAGFEVGTRTAVDVVASERLLLQARRDYSQSRYDYVLDTLRLKQAAGILSTDDLIAIGNWLE